jgi:DNA modification methylase
VALGVHGRDRTNVWTYAGANQRGSSAAKALADHPTPKPVELVVDALLDVTQPGNVVLDPFSGGGATIIASEHCDREARGIELDPKYVDRSIRRWERLTGDRAIHVDTGLTFSELAEQRVKETGQGSNG